MWGRRGGRKSITLVQMPEMGWRINDVAQPHFLLRVQYSILPLRCPFLKRQCVCHNSLDSQRRSNWKGAQLCKLAFGLEGDSRGVIILSSHQPLIKCWRHRKYPIFSVLVASSLAFSWVINRANQLKSVCFILSQTTGQYCLLF